MDTQNVIEVEEEVQTLADGSEGKCGVQQSDVIEIKAEDHVVGEGCKAKLIPNHSLINMEEVSEVPHDDMFTIDSTGRPFGYAAKQVHLYMLPNKQKSVVLMVMQLCKH